MTKEQLKVLLTENSPLTIRLTSGKEYKIPNLDWIWIPPSGNTVLLEDEHQLHHTILLTHIESVSCADKPAA